MPGGGAGGGAATSGEGEGERQAAVSVRYRATVGADVSRMALDSVFGRLVVEARTKFHQRHFEEALHIFRQCQALFEQTYTGAGDHAEYGALLHNLGSCLHCLGEFEEAKGYYEQALAAFQRSPPSRFWIALYGDVDQRRCEFVRERLVDCELRRTPDLEKYLDGRGHKRPVVADLAQPPPRSAAMPTFYAPGFA